ncbi:hypothetical protein, partial [Pseudomonas tehranensis]|uniref:hypothetical protein n=1 Tax=Pseudomonas tehranensis TaxID=2745502 RepID=UPI001CD84884
MTVFVEIAHLGHVRWVATDQEFVAREQSSHGTNYNLLTFNLQTQLGNVISVRRVRLFCGEGIYPR